MSDFLERASKLSPKQLLLLALEQQERLDALEARAHSAIAIVGMACRFPGGADDPQSFWRLLAEGRDATGPIPADRWDSDVYFDPDPDNPGTIAARTGGFLENISGFDAAFFGISQREAKSMDPQQRLLLEVAWEALENASLPADSLFGTPAGVFIGLCNNDHFTRLLANGDEAIDAYLASGNAPSVAAGRISYCLGLQGPAVTVDTACSSSLIALHLACRSLRTGESRVALACGVNVMCAPQTSISLSRSHMLAPDGRCKTFDASADGFSRGEGCGVIVLKRLDDALADGDTVLALVRGTATNQDGRSGGLTVPNGPAQEAVIRAALADAALAPGDIDYVEAHGTGTSLGDPIEVRAIAAALGKDRDPARPLLIGSVKTNIGHLESAAGIAGVIKVVLALRQGRLPPHLHFRTPSPHIPWSELPIAVTADGAEWQPGERRRRAGVSSFGFSGSNAHVVLEEAPPAAAPVSDTRSGFHCLPLSARSSTALASLAGRAADQLAKSSDLDLASVARRAGSGRSHHGHRLAVVADSLASARSAISAATAGASHPALRRGEPLPGQRPEVVFLFTGQGSQYRGMGRELYDTYPAFRSVIDECDAILGRDAHGLSLKHVLWNDDAAMHETVWTQPALFAVEVAAARLWQDFGITPAAVIGHSLGEYAAACVAGVFSLADGLKLVVERGRLTQALPGGAAMAAVFASSDVVAAVIASHGDKVSIAAVNAADNVVISGEAPAVERVVADFSVRHIEARRLQISFAAHSPLVEPALDLLEQAARAVPMRAPKVPVAWNRGGLSMTCPDATYWRHHLRDTVRFGDGIQALHREGYRIFLEVGPHPTLVALAQRTIGEDKAVWLSTMRRGKPDSGELANSLAELYVQGAQIKWNAVEPHGRSIPWPTYPFEHREYWVTPDPNRAQVGRRSARDIEPLSGRRLATATPTFETRLAPGSPAGLEDHRVQGRVIVPGPAIVAMARACAERAFGRKPSRIENLVFRAPLVLPDDGRIVQTELRADDHGRARFTVSSRGDDEKSPWTVHATGAVAEGEPDATSIDLPALTRRLGPERETTAFRDRIAELGIAFGPTFRVLGRQRSRDGEALVRLHRPSGSATAIADIAMVDGALQALGVAAFESGRIEGMSMLSEIGNAWWRPGLPAEVLAHATLRDGQHGTSGRLAGDVCLFDDAGNLLGRMQGVTLDRAPASSTSGLTYQVVWRPADVEAPACRFLTQPPSTADLAHLFDNLADRHGLAVYDELLPTLDRLSANAIVTAFRELGFDERAGRTLATDKEAVSLGIVPRHVPLFRRLLAILAMEGSLSRSADCWTITGPLPPPSADSFAAALSRFAGAEGELQLLERCSGALARVLRGEQDPLDLLFPGGSFREARAIYVESPFARTYNEALRTVLTRVVDGVPQNATVRVLEIGAGTGGTTRFVLPALPKTRTSYTFTDVSPAFLEAAEIAFTDAPFLSTALLDMEREPAEQGFVPGSYDVVIAANVLHATTDLARSLRRARNLLAPGGVLLLLEGVTPERWVDLTFGMTKGWWHFTDIDLRPDYPLVSRASWQTLLAEAGFESVVMTPEHGPGRRARAQQVLMVARRPSEPRQVTIVASDRTIADGLVHAVAGRGDSVRVMESLPAEGVAGDLIHLGATDLADLGFDDAGGAEAASQQACYRPLRDLVAFARHPSAGRAWLVTRGAQSVAGAIAPRARWQSPLWGLGRVFGLEHPDHWGGLVDLPPDGDPAQYAEALVRTMDACDGEDQTAFREGRRLAARLTPVSVPEVMPIALRRDGSYLVTGGFGGLGGCVARWLAERGAGRIILAGRHPQPDSEIIREIEARGVAVEACRLDVADEGDVAGLVKDLAQRGHTLRGIVHAAADLSSAPMHALNEDTVKAMLRPKIAGTDVLERLTRSRDRDFVALFSSSTSLLGAADYAHYAAANAFLDGMAASAPLSNGRIVAINWGTWEVMRTASEQMRQSYLDIGMEPLGTEQALDLLGRALASGEHQMMIARLDWSRFKPIQEARRRRPFLADVGGGTAAGTGGEQASEAAAALMLQLSSFAPDGREQALIDFVRANVVATLGDEGMPPGVDVGMFDLGMDSLMAVDLKRRLEVGIGLSLPSTLTFNYPTIRAMAGYLGRVLAPTGDGAVTDGEASPRGGVAPGAAALQATDLETLSDEDLAARLLARLEEIK